jgi:hypothetical protein
MVVPMHCDICPASFRCYGHSLQCSIYQALCLSGVGSIGKSHAADTELPAVIARVEPVRSTLHKQRTPPAKSESRDAQASGLKSVRHRYVRLKSRSIVRVWHSTRPR